MEKTKITVIGAGNMGGAIAKGLAGNDNNDVTVTDLNNDTLRTLVAAAPALHTSTHNIEAALDADVIIFAVKPWIMPGVVAEVTDAVDLSGKLVVSIVGGMSLDALDAMLKDTPQTSGDKSLPPVFHLIPNTAIALGKSMTFISSRRATDKQRATVSGLFKELGEVALLEERLMDAATALSSCGIAYVYKFVQACVQAGVQLGFYPHQALEYVNATVAGAVALLQHNGTLPQQEIDKVTTPGGMTIKGINTLDQEGFTSAVIKAILSPLQH